MKSLSLSKILLSMVVVALLGCSSSDDVQYVAEGDCATEGVASKLGGVVEMEDGIDESFTRSLFIGGSTGTRFSQIWDDYDQPEVYKNGVYVGSLKPQTTGVTTSVLSGVLSGSFTVGDQLDLYIPSKSVVFTNQDGTIGKLSKNYSVMSTTATVASVNGSTISTSEMQFLANVLYFYFQFRDENDRLLHVKKFTFTNESGDHFVATKDMSTGDATYTNELVINLDKEKNTDDYPYTIYVSIINTNTSTKDTYSLRVLASDGKTYELKNAFSYLFVAGKLVAARFKLSCIDVEAGVSTGITPPTDEDVVIDNVTKE